MKRIVLLLALVACVWCADGASAQTRVPVWEVVEVAEESTDGPDAAAESVEAEISDGKVYIRVQHPVEVRVYSILGQLVTKRKLAPGTTALTLGSRGIYILKTDTVTKRINL